MKFIDAIKADLEDARQTGTDGRWWADEETGEVMLEENALIVLATAEDATVARRIARLPDLERMSILVEELLRASRKWMLPEDVEKNLLALCEIAEENDTSPKSGLEL